MILAPEETKSSKKLLVSEDKPPSYTASEASTAILNSSVPSVQPCNFVNVFREDSKIKGTWLLDPTLSIPPELLPPLSEGESEQTRKNLSLQTKDGSIKATIFVLPTTTEALRQTENRPLRTLIDTSTKDGDVTIRIHEVLSQMDHRLPIQLRSYSGDGSIRVYLPRTFRGVCRLKTKDGRIQFSKAMESSLTRFSDVNGSQVGFLGSLDVTEWQPGMNWNGDELTLETKDGNVHVYFDDEKSSPGRFCVFGYLAAFPFLWLPAYMAARKSTY